MEDCQVGLQYSSCMNTVDVNNTDNKANYSSGNTTEISDDTQHWRPRASTVTPPRPFPRSRQPQQPHPTENLQDIGGSYGGLLGGGYHGGWGGGVRGRGCMDIRVGTTFQMSPADIESFFSISSAAAGLVQPEINYFNNNNNNNPNHNYQNNGGSQNHNSNNNNNSELTTYKETPPTAAIIPPPPIIDRPIIADALLALKHAVVHHGGQAPHRPTLFSPAPPPPPPPSSPLHQPPFNQPISSPLNQYSVLTPQDSPTRTSPAPLQPPPNFSQPSSFSPYHAPLNRVTHNLTNPGEAPQDSRPISGFNGGGGSSNGRSNNLGVRCASVTPPTSSYLNSPPIYDYASPYPPYSFHRQYSHHAQPQQHFSYHYRGGAGGGGDGGIGWPRPSFDGRYEVGGLGGTDSPPLPAPPPIAASFLRGGQYAAGLFPSMSVNVSMSMELGMSPYGPLAGFHGLTPGGRYGGGGGGEGCAPLHGYDGSQGWVDHPGQQLWGSGGSGGGGGHSRQSPNAASSPNANVNNSANQNELVYGHDFYPSPSPYYSPPSPGQPASQYPQFGSKSPPSSGPSTTYQYPTTPSNQLQPSRGLQQLMTSLPSGEQNTRGGYSSAAAQQEPECNHGKPDHSMVISKFYPYCSRRWKGGIPTAQVHALYRTPPTDNDHREHHPSHHHHHHSHHAHHEDLSGQQQYQHRQQPSIEGHGVVVPGRVCLGEKINLCRICGKSYARPSTLKTHLRTHSGEKPYVCGTCMKSFSQAANLTAHVRTHSGEKPFNCPICDRRFSQSSSVTTHMRTHSGERPYRCRMCKKTFSDSSTLTKHLRIHSGEKPYHCKVCLLRFSQSGNLNRHMRVHCNNN